MRFVNVKLLMPIGLALLLLGAAATAVWAAPPQQAQTNNFLRGGIVINEVLPDPKASGGRGFDTDGNGDINKLDEFVEIYNRSNNAINLEGLELWDRGTGKWFTFPNAQLQPGAYAVVIASVQAGGVWPTARGDSFFFNAGLDDDPLANKGGNVVLFDPGTRQYVQVKYSERDITGTVQATDDPVALSKTLDGNGDIEGYEGFDANANRVGNVEEYFYEENEGDGVSVTRELAGSTVWTLHNQNPRDDDAEDASPGARSVTAVTLRRMQLAPAGGAAVWLAALPLAVATAVLWRRYTA